MTLHFPARALRARTDRLICTAILTAMLLSACGGGGGSDSSSQPPPSGSAPLPGSSNPPPDTTAPTISTTVSIANDIVTFVSEANDNVGVTSVSFLADNGAIQGDIQKSPSGGSYTLKVPTNIIGAGDHTVSSKAVDAAGNTATSAVVAFNIGGQSSGPDTTPPTVTAAVEGNFGLVKLTAIAADDRRVDVVDFTVDGKQIPTAGTAAYVNTDPDNQYYKRFDTTGLADGPHVMVARAFDRAFNTTSSEQVTFNVDSTAGLFEMDPNDSIGTATPVMRSQLQIAGTLKTVITVIGDSQILRPDDDYYQISLAAGETVSINMLSTQSFFLRVVDVNGTNLSADSTYVSSDVMNAVYTNGSTPQDVYIRVTSIPFDFGTDNQYKLTLTYR